MSREHWLWLAHRPGCSALTADRLLIEFGSPEAVWEADRRQFQELDWLRRQQIDSLCSKGLDNAQHTLEYCAEKDIDLLTLEDEGYPERLKNIPDPPPVLYVRGRLPDPEKLPIAMVGTRKASDYGMRAARWLSANLARSGCVIVSGMALGIDGMANRAAVEFGGETIAVLGSGVDVCYPSEHSELMERILAHGAVISEFQPGSAANGRNFPIRNRIISGLSAGVVIVEAPKRSGALITADCALEQGRDVFAVPGNLNEPNSAGTNGLIRQGAAELITCAADILEQYRGITVQREHRSAAEPLSERKQVRIEPELPETHIPEADVRQPVPEEKRPQFPLSAEERRVLKAVRAGADSVDAAAESTGFSAAQILGIVTVLEMNDLVARDGSRLRAL
ncbi:MAG: DNA-processing protein DprA [Butyricicoccaceae bacterium]